MRNKPLPGIAKKMKDSPFTQRIKGDAINQPIHPSFGISQAMNAATAGSGGGAMFGTKRSAVMGAAVTQARKDWDEQNPGGFVY